MQVDASDTAVQLPPDPHRPTTASASRLGRWRGLSGATGTSIDLAQYDYFVEADAV